MKRNTIQHVLLTAFLGIFCLAMAHDGMAQRKKKKKKSKKGSSTKVDKKEVKKWKKKLKSLDPLQYKQISEEYNLLKGENSALKRQVSTLENQVSAAEESLSDKESQLSGLNSRYESLKKKPASSPKVVRAPGDDYSQGIVYRVQIGAFRNPKLKSLQSKGEFWVEDGDGTRKYTIANFRDYWEANTFKKYMREMGVKDAWIVAYENNERKDIKEVLKKSKTTAN